MIIFLFSEIELSYLRLSNFYFIKLNSPFPPIGVCEFADTFVEDELHSTSTLINRRIDSKWLTLKIYIQIYKYVITNILNLIPIIFEYETNLRILQSTNPKKIYILHLYNHPVGLVPS